MTPEQVVERYRPRIGVRNGKKMLYFPHMTPQQFARLEAEIMPLKPRIVAILEREEALAGERARRLRNLEGRRELEQARRALGEWYAARTAAIEGDGTTPVPECPVSDEDMAALEARYPLAALYHEAEKLSQSPNMELAAIGNHAIDAIADGAPATQVRALIDREHAQFCQRHLWD